MQHVFFRRIRPVLAPLAAACIRWPIFIAFALPAIGAYAACTAPGDFIIPVGDVKHDAACEFKDIQAAIDAATCPGTTIVITSELAYTKQALTINDKQLFLYGAKDCSETQAPAPGPQVQIDGADNGTHSVIAIGGNSSVAMQNLMITGANLPAGNSGGGVYMKGKGDYYAYVVMSNVTVAGNQAGFGAGVYLRDAQLDIGANTLIMKNTAAHDGGGIYVDYHAGASVSGQNTSIYANTAAGITTAKGGIVRDGYGGGIMLARNASLKLSGPGVPGIGGGAGLGIVDGNQAWSGGGIAMLGIDVCGVGTVSTQSPDSVHPVPITSNHASGNGGAIYAKPYYDVSGIFCPGERSDFNDVRIASNTAWDGAAIYLDWDTTALVDDTGENFYFNSPPTDPGASGKGSATGCSGQPGCNTIEDNVARDADGKRTKGSTIFVGISSEFRASRMIFRRNVGDDVFYVRGDNDHGESVRLVDALIDHNTLARSVLTQENDDAPVTVDSSTIADNKIAGATMFAAHSPFTLTNSVLGGSTKALAYSGSSTDLVVANVVAGNTIGLPAADSVVQGDAGFVDPANLDYRLADGSIALDFAPATDLKYDLAGKVRTVDLPDHPNQHGPRDLGAYERDFNIAAAASGSTAIASSTVPETPLQSFDASTAIDGDRTGVRWAQNPGGGWNDGTVSIFPDALDIDFGTDRTIDRVVVTTLQDNYMLGMEPTATMTFTAYGLTAFRIERWDASIADWVGIKSITGNNLVKRTIDFAPVTTSKIRILCAASADGQYSRIVEIEAFGG